MAGGLNDRGCAWWGACVAGGHASPPPDTMRYGEIRSMSGRYASY